MRRIGHNTYDTILRTVSLAVVLNAMVLIGSLPLVLLLVTTDPMRSWPAIAVAAPFAAPAVVAAFSAFREHGRGGPGPFRAFVRGLRATWRKALTLGALATIVLVVLAVDVRMLADTSFSVFTVPLLGVLAFLAATTALLSFVALAEAPDTRVRDLLRASLYLGLKRWYLSVVSVLVVAAQAAVFASLPAIGIGVTASAALYLVWANSRYALATAFAVDEVQAA